MVKPVAVLSSSRFSQLWNGWKASLLNAKYFRKSHIIWYNSDKPDPSLEQVIKKAMHSCEPVFLYRCGGRVSPLPTEYYWRMMDKHPSMRIYQLEVRAGD